MLRYIFRSVCVIVMCVMMSCSGGSAGGGGSGIGDSQSLTGTVFAPNGLDPVASATVYVPASAASSSLSKIVGEKTVSATCSGVAITCSNPTATALTSTCTCPDGTFTLDLSALTAAQRTAATQLKIEKGDTSKTVSLSCSGSSCALATSDTTLAASGTGALRMAVVTGLFDSMENVLAKLGYGTLGSDGAFTVGTEQFAIYRGGGDIDAQLTNTTTYKASTELFSSLTTMQQYDIIFIDCGTDESLTGISSNLSMPKGITHEQYHALQKSFAKSIPASVITNLQAYVNGGGKLFVTDWAYDFVEQSFPEVMDFEGSTDGSSTVAESETAARLGAGGIVSDATVSNNTLAVWLSARSSNTIAAALSPNSGSCDTSVNGGTSSLQTSGSIRIGDFLSLWVVMKAAYDSSTTVWIQGPVSFSGVSSAGTETRPLTVSRSIGSNGGKILYSSYHTSHSCPTSGFWPQERVLEYLVFEVAQ